MKKTNRHIVLSALTAAAAWGLASCSQETLSDSLHQADRPITFTTTVEATTLQTPAV